MKTLPMCESQHKKRYPTKGAAIKAALSYSRRRGTPLRVYRHAACGGFHLTKTARFDFDTNIEARTA